MMICGPYGCFMSLILPEQHVFCILFLCNSSEPCATSCLHLFPSSVFESWAVSSLCVSSLLLHREHDKVAHGEQKNPIAIVMSELLETGKLSRGLQNRAPPPLSSCQTGLNTVFRVVTQRHTITIIDIQLCTSSLYIFSWRAAVCSCSSVMVQSHPVLLGMRCIK